MKLSRKHKMHTEVASSPLNDIMFFLLLFFLILSTISAPSAIRVLLPKAEIARSVGRQPITLTITEDKKYFVNDQEIGFRNLEQHLKEALDSERDATVLIRPNRALQVQDLVEVLEIGANNNMKMFLSTTQR